MNKHHVLVFPSTPRVSRPSSVKLSQLSQPKSAVHKQAAIGGTSKEILSSVILLKRPTDYLNQGRTGSQYDKNA
jgi:hypothetical protein